MKPYVLLAKVKFKVNLASPDEPMTVGVIMAFTKKDGFVVRFKGIVPGDGPTPPNLLDADEIGLLQVRRWPDQIERAIRSIVDEANSNRTRLDASIMMQRLCERFRWNLFIERPERLEPPRSTVGSTRDRTIERYVPHPPPAWMVDAATREVPYVQ